MRWFDPLALHVHTIPVYDKEELESIKHLLESHEPQVMDLAIHYTRPKDRVWVSAAGTFEVTFSRDLYGFRNHFGTDITLCVPQWVVGHADSSANHYLVAEKKSFGRLVSFCFLEYHKRKPNAPVLPELEF